MKINMKLSTRSIEQAIRNVERFKQDVIRKVHQLVQMLVDYGVEYAKSTVIEMGAYFSGELESSIEGYYSPALGAGFITAGAEYACYIEFGTGIKGKGKPHPAPQGWKYDMNNHGEKGWFYFKDGEWHWTKGMESRPFMYETAKELETIVLYMAQEVFDA